MKYSLTTRYSKSLESVSKKYIILLISRFNDNINFECRKKNNIKKYASKSNERS